jgi:hypothetical protein
MIEYYRELLKPVFSGRRFLHIGGAVPALRATAKELAELGAERPFLLGSTLGVGGVPDDDEAAWYALDERAEDAIQAIWAYEARLRDLPHDARVALERWDPDRRARALGAIVLSDVREVAGRARYARRLPEWAALEDKTQSPAFFDSIGVRRGALAVVRAEPGCLRSADARLDRGLGTVWAGDTRQGINGGGAFVRWVRGEESAREAEAFFAARCDRVRVMPFIAGIPCSIHGIVFPEGAAVFRPIEMLTLRRPTAGRFTYAGTASYWDPPADDRAAMRETARRVAEGLRAQLGYRGAFTLDGVLGPDGFVPTELNPRIGAGMRHLCERTPELPLLPLAFAAAEGEPLDYRPRALEEVVLELADAKRSGGPRVSVPTRWDETRSLRLVERPEGVREADEGEEADGVLLAGPSDTGGFATYIPRIEGVAIGPSFAPRAVRVLAAADALVGADIGPLEAAQPVR